MMGIVMKPQLFSPYCVQTANNSCKNDLLQASEGIVLGRFSDTRTYKEVCDSGQGPRLLGPTWTSWSERPRLSRTSAVTWLASPATLPPTAVARFPFLLTDGLCRPLLRPLRGCCLQRFWFSPLVTPHTSPGQSDPHPQPGFSHLHARSLPLQTVSCHCLLFPQPGRKIILQIRDHAVFFSCLPLILYPGCSLFIESPCLPYLTLRTPAHPSRPPPKHRLR